MAHLTLAGASDDGKRLLLTGDEGVEHTLDITPGLRAALRGTGPRPRQLETPMDSTLRPRDIQARIRAGESAEAVAEAAHTSLDKIMAFAGPVLAERAHVADRAQRSTVRRPAGESPDRSRVLGDVVEAHLRACNVDPTTVEWDSWRREDGRWTLVGHYSAGARVGAAEFTYDAPGNYVLLDNEDARWLVGEQVGGTPAPAGRDDLGSARARRLSAVPADELPLGDDAIELVSGAADEPLPDSVLDAFLDTSAGSDDAELREEAADAAADEPDPEPPARRPVAKKKGRASVPSWDEIMFGGGDQ